MRIGIITFHHAYNYGAFLQTEGLYGSLQRLGHEPEIIDYRNAALEAVHERCIRYGWHPLRKLAGYKRRSKFIEALGDFNLSPVTRGAAGIEWDRYDAIVYGSDEIWNYSSHVHRFDPVYFGAGVPSTLRKIAYAPSLGELDWRQREIPQEMHKLFQDFTAIAVRDRNAADFVQSVTGTPPPIVVDPVFLHHRADLPEIRRPQKPYALIYGEIRDPRMVEACRSWVKRHGWISVSVGYRNPWCDRVVLQTGPHDFLSWLSGSQAVLTTTFHGTMFSIKLGKTFLTLRSETARRKFSPLIPSLGLEDRFIANPEEIASKSPEMNHTQTKTHLQDRISSSIDYLKDNLLESI